MSTKWTTSSKHPGVRWREHATRKHGIKFDRYFVIYARIGGKRQEEALGWASEGWTEATAAHELGILKANARLGEGPTRLSEKRAKAQAQRYAEIEAANEAKAKAITFQTAAAQYFNAQRGQKKSAGKEENVFKNWLSDLAEKPIADLCLLDLERVKKAVLDKGLKPQTALHVLNLARQIFGYAERYGLYTGPWPGKGIKLPKYDCKRTRFLNVEEINLLLPALKVASLSVHDQAMIALFCGLRAGEILSLQWSDVDFAHGRLGVRDTKGGQNRHVPLSAPVLKMLKECHARRDELSPYVFPPRTRTGLPPIAIGSTFDRVVDRLGLNEGITDSRQKLVFHSLRHTHASHLVMRGVPLITVAKLLGHSTIAMSERYSHLAPEHLDAAVEKLGDLLI